MCTIKVTNIRGEVKGIHIRFTFSLNYYHHHTSCKRQVQSHATMDQHSYRFVNKPVEYVVYCFPNKCSMTQKSTIDLVQDGLEEISDE